MSKCDFGPFLDQTNPLSRNKVFPKIELLGFFSNSVRDQPMVEQNKNIIYLTFNSNKFSNQPA